MDGRFSTWITLPQLSSTTAHKVTDTGILSCRRGHFESMIHVYLILNRVVRDRPLVQIKSSSTARAVEEMEQFFILHNPCKNVNTPTSHLTHTLL